MFNKKSAQTFLIILTAAPLLCANFALAQEESLLPETISETIVETPLTDLSVDTSDLPASTPQDDGIPPFSDVKPGSEYYFGLKKLKSLGLIQGYEDGTFKPKQAINRAEALKLLVRAIPYQSMSNQERPLATLNATAEITGQPSCPFPDLDTKAWYFQYVCEAFNNQVVAGYPDGTFHPEQTINEVEALKIIILQSGLTTETGSAENFDDVPPDTWFTEYAKLANQKTFVVEDRDGNLNAADQLNRGDFAMTIYRTLQSTKAGSEFGRATFYGGRFDGQGTASGETFDTSVMTAAHKTLPFGTIVRVTNLTNGKTVDVRINDRGPYVNGTIIDLSTSAFKAVDSVSTGVFQSEIQILQPAT
ncbi:septal ring lytic transglycosylase RlpA family protein [Candidatus Peregrinibacteria bacterium]|nr:septal ring lytic transglycosylase RlpA family protein [Candidatus Peregrinibacteria bacterium]